MFDYTMKTIVGQITRYIGFASRPREIYLNANCRATLKKQIFLGPRARLQDELNSNSLLCHSQFFRARAH